MKYLVDYVLEMLEVLELFGITAQYEEKAESIEIRLPDGDTVEVTNNMYQKYSPDDACSMFILDGIADNYVYGWEEGV